MPTPAQSSTQLAIFQTVPLDQSGKFALPWINFLSGIFTNQKNAPQFFFSNHAQRIGPPGIAPSSVGIGTLFFELDRGAVYIATATAWLYLAGVMQTIRANLPTDLGANDAGFLANLTDFAHALQWTGSAWQFGPGDAGGGYTVPFVGSPNPLAGWHAANGAQIEVLNGNGSLRKITTPNTAGSFTRL